MQPTTVSHYDDTTHQNDFRNSAASSMTAINTDNKDDLEYWSCTKSSEIYSAKIASL